MLRDREAGLVTRPHGVELPHRRHERDGPGPDQDGRPVDGAARGQRQPKALEEMVLGSAAGLKPEQVLHLVGGNCHVLAALGSFSYCSCAIQNGSVRSCRPERPM